MTDDREARRQRLEIDVDTRLMRVWPHVAPIIETLGEKDRITLACALRAAYSEGYVDALQEDAAGRRSELSRVNGYAVI